MTGLIERIQSRIELFRLEQRYTRRRNRRSTFVSNAIYVDGEYVYQTPASTGSSSTTTNTSSSTAASPAQEAVSPSTTTSASTPADKKMRRFSSMPGFGSLSKAGGGRSAVQDWRGSRVSVSEVR